MNICIISSLKMGTCQGGIESVCYNLAHEILRRKEHKLYQLHLNNNICEDVPGVNYLHLLPIHQTTDFIHQIRTFIESNEIDIIWNHTMNVPLVQRLRKAVEGKHTKIVTVYHTAPNTALAELREVYSQCIFKRDWKTYFRLLVNYPRNLFGVYRRCRADLCKIAECSDCVCLLSKAYINEYKRLCLKNYRNLHSISNPIPNTPGTESIQVKKNQVLVVARHEWKHKRLDRIISIWKSVEEIFPEWKLVILGNGQAHNDFVNYAKEIGVKNVTFEGMVSPEPYYSESKIICLTSGWEGLPMVLIEAQKHGCVPVSYKSFAALPDIIHNGKTGYMIPAFKKNQFISKLTHLMDNATLLEEMAKNCELHAKNFAVDAITNKWINLFESIVEEK